MTRHCSCPDCHARDRAQLVARTAVMYAWAWGWPWVWAGVSTACYWLGSPLW